MRPRSQDERWHTRLLPQAQTQTGGQLRCIGRPRRSHMRATDHRSNNELCRAGQGGQGRRLPSRKCALDLRKRQERCTCPVGETFAHTPTNALRHPTREVTISCGSAHANPRCDAPDELRLHSMRATHGDVLRTSLVQILPDTLHLQVALSGPGVCKKNTGRRPGTPLTNEFMERAPGVGATARSAARRRVRISGDRQRCVGICKVFEMRDTDSDDPQEPVEEQIPA